MWCLKIIVIVQRINISLKRMSQLQIFFGILVLTSFIFINLQFTNLLEIQNKKQMTANNIKSGQILICKFLVVKKSTFQNCLNNYSF